MRLTICNAAPDGSACVRNYKYASNREILRGHLTHNYTQPVRVTTRSQILAMYYTPKNPDPTLEIHYTVLSPLSDLVPHDSMPLMIDELDRL